MADAYWLSGLDWKAVGGAFIAFCGGIGAASPVIKALQDGRLTKAQTAAKEMETAVERNDRLARENYAAMQASRDYWQAQFRAEVAAHIITKADREDGWDFGRGMEQLAHDIRHDLRDLVQHHNSLLKQCQGFVSGKMTPENFAWVIGELQPAAEPARVPPLREVERKTAGGD